MVGLLEQVRVDAECDVRVRVPELAADKDDVQALRDQKRGEAVTERVEGQPLARLVESGAFDGLPEAFADVAGVEAAPDRVAEDQLVRPLVRGGEPALGSSFATAGARTTSRFPASVFNGRWTRRGESCRWTRITPAL